MFFGDFGDPFFTFETVIFLFVKDDANLIFENIYEKCFDHLKCSFQAIANEEPQAGGSKLYKEVVCVASLGGFSWCSPVTTGYHNHVIGELLLSIQLRPLMWLKTV